MGIPQLTADKPKAERTLQFAGDKLALHNLELDEAAALTLYTMECELYPTLNGLLRNRNRKELIPFFPYVSSTPFLCAFCGAGDFEYVRSEVSG